MLPSMCVIICNPFSGLQSFRKQVSGAFCICGVKNHEFSRSWAPSSGMNEKGVFQSLVKTRAEAGGDLNWYSSIIFSSAGLM